MEKRLCPLSSRVRFTLFAEQLPALTVKRHDAVIRCDTGMVAAQVWSVLGGALNTARAPECWLPIRIGKPGRLDYWLNSHQLMHILVAIAMTHLHWGATLDYRYYASKPECA